MTGREGAVDIVWQGAILFGTAIPIDEIGTWIHWSGIHSHQHPGALATNCLSHFLPQLCAGLLYGFSQFPASWDRTNAWCSHTAHSALIPPVLYRSTGCPSPFHPIRLVLARLAQTLSKLGRFNAPSFQICLPRGPSATKNRPRVRRMRTVRERRVAQSISLPTRILRPSAPAITAVPADLNGDSARHRQV